MSNLIRLNDEQRQIVEHDINSDQLVLACAGSGKSTTMVYRVKYLIEKGVKPENIMMTTFNVDACESLKNKIKIIFDTFPNITIGTFDGIACKFYNKYFRKDYYVGINEYTTEFLNYLQTEQGKMLSTQFKYIIFDEFQDINNTQFDVIKKFYEYGVHVILIGDDAQNIYQWRGSNIKYILHAKEYFPTIHKQFISINYRSCSEIIEFANDSIKNNHDNIQKKMISHMGDTGNKPIIVHYRNLEIQGKSIVEQIGNILSVSDTKVKPCDIAIISRNNYPNKYVEEAFECYNKSHSNKIKYISLITSGDSDIKPKVNNECVTVTTIHKAKGLEWDHVFFVSCDDETIPSNIDSIGIQEERRLFYVAITRAKRYLWISFTRNTVSRFIGELNKNLYSFPNVSKGYFKYNNNRSHLTDFELPKIINSLNDENINFMRYKGMIPEICPRITNVHDAHLYNGYIDEKYLHGDFNNFITRYTQRYFGDLANNKKCFYDLYARSLLSVTILTRNMYNIYTKSRNLIEAILPQIGNDTQNEEIINVMQTTNIQYDKNDEKNIIKVIHSILENRCNIDDDVFVTPEQYLPEDYLEELITHYKVYSDNKINTKTILENIYNVSICENICNGRRRLLYQNVISHFTENNNTMFTDIEKFISKLKKSFSNNIICNKRIRLGKLNMVCDTNVIDLSKKVLFEIHCAGEKECKLEWLLQAIGKVSMIKYLDPTININLILIYNPMQGLFIQFDISNWMKSNKNEEFMKYLCSIRNVEYKENDNPQKFMNYIENQEEILHQETQDKFLELCDKKVKKIQKQENTKCEEQVNDAGKLHDSNNIVFDNNVSDNIEIEELSIEDIEGTTKNEKDIVQNEKKMRINIGYKKKKKNIEINDMDKDTLIIKIQEMRTQIHDISNKISRKQMRLNARKKEMFKNIMHCIKCNEKEPEPCYIVFDTETTGLPMKHINVMTLKDTYAYNTARILQMSWGIYDAKGKLIELRDYIIKPEGYKVDATEIHGITQSDADEGYKFIDIAKIFLDDIKKVNYIIGHNVMFDINIMRDEYIRRNMTEDMKTLNSKETICTANSCKELCGLKRMNGGLKYPKQCELFEFMYGMKMSNAHNSKYDVINLGLIVTKLIKDEFFEIV